MADITVTDLNNIAGRLEASFQREVDRIEEQVDRLVRRGEAADEKIAKHSEDIRVLQHDMRDVKNVRLGAAAPAGRPVSKAFIAGVVAAIVGLAGVGEGVLSALKVAAKFVKP